MNIQDVRQKFPQYQDLSDDQLASAIHRKFYSDMPFEQFSAKIGAQQTPPQEQGGTMLDKAALVGRAAFEGVTGLPVAFAQAMDPAAQLKKSLFGVPTGSDRLTEMIDEVAPTKAKTKDERLMMDTVRGVTGGLSTGGTAPVLSAVSGGLGGASSGLAREAGGGTVAQIAAGLAGGMTPTAMMLAAQKAIQGVGRALPTLAEPFTQGGRERIAARAIQGAATDPVAAAQAARTAPQHVPGSRPTLAQATDDVGLAMQEKALGNRFKDDFAGLEKANDAARQAALTKSFGTGTDIKIAEDRLTQVTQPMRDAAFQNAKAVNTRPIANTADSILKSGAGKRQEVEKAMDWVKTRIEGEKNPQRLYAVRQDINDIIAGKLAGDPEKASLKLASKQLIAIRGVLDEQIEKAAPGFKDYLKTYAGMSKEIDKARLGQEIRDKATNPLTERLSPAQYTREFEKRGQEIADAGPVASDALTRVATDLRRAVAPSVAGRAAGSDTSQNLIAQNMLSRAGMSPNGPITNAASRGMSFLYKPFQAEEQIQQVLRDAYLDPKMGAALLSMPLPQQKALFDNIREQLMAIQRGGLFGTTSQLLAKDE